MPKNAEILTNPHADRVRRVADLSNTKARRKTGKFLIEGPQAVREVVKYRPELIDDIYYLTEEPGENATASITAAAEIVSLAETAAADIYTHEVIPEVLLKMSKDAQSIVAVGHSEGLIFTGPVLEVEPGDMVAACWQVRDPGNEGTVIRTADASGCTAVLLVGDCVDPLNPKVIRATAGSLFHLPVCLLTEEEFFTWAQNNSVRVWAADVYGTEEQPAHDLPDLLETTGQASDSRAIGVLFGNEARGLPSAMIEQAELAVRIPLYGNAESLNLAMSSAVLLYSLAMSSRVGTMAKNSNR